jgi:protein-disulfide isomerase
VQRAVTVKGVNGDGPDILMALPDDHIRGAAGAGITIVEYGDYECPYCAAAHPILRDLVLESEGRIRLVFRNFPLVDLHPYALTAALAAEAAGGQRVFWGMHDMIFEHQDRLRDADLARYAESLGIDPTLVVGDPAQPYGDKVERDFESGLMLGVHGTPTLFLEGSRYEGPIEVSALRRAADASARRLDGPRRAR